MSTTETAPTTTPTSAPSSTAPNATAAKKEKARQPAKSGKPKKASSAKAARKRTRMSGLDAAAKVLAGAREPMRCTDLATAIIKRGLWSTKGKTPAATLNSAIIREIKSKGRESRFKKSGRGLFAVGPGAST